MRRIELLAPAKDAAIAIAAIDCGADAVYLGAPRFSARDAAGNSIEDIRRVVEYAHPYYVKVYAALNTLLYDDELPIAEKMALELYEAGVDGLIIQDMGLLELDLPPMPLIASTQTNNATPEKVKFLEEVGFSRVILARELTLEQIRQIRKQTQVELECFVHGALCVGASGQCYMSYALGGRSGNRGQCAQPCRRRYTLKDAAGNTLAAERCLLSIKDLNLSDYLEDLLDAGVTSFKIEGRLKDVDYVANVVGFYRRKLDAILERKGLRKSSSGVVRLKFQPDPQKTFNRGYTDYGIDGKAAEIGSIYTPKSTGQYVGTVVSVGRNDFVLDGDVELHNADGVCFLDAGDHLIGTAVNGVQGRTVMPQKIDGIRPGLKIFRNYDHEFVKVLDTSPAERKIAIAMVFREAGSGFQIEAKDEDGNVAEVDILSEKQIAQKPDAARQTIETQLKKLGNTIFECTDLRLDLSQMYFFPVSTLNAIKRDVTQKLLDVRRLSLQNRQSIIVGRQSVPYPEKHLSYFGNVLNEKAKAFYRKHGVETIEPGAEMGLDMTGRAVMATKYCLRRQLGLCGGGKLAAPLTLIDEQGRSFRVEFRCGECGMTLYQE